MTPDMATPVTSPDVLGWIINLARDGETREEWRDQPPVFFLSDGEPVYEVWHWHPLLKRWFVMSRRADLRMIRQGVVYFRPDDVPDPPEGACGTE